MSAKLRNKQDNFISDAVNTAKLLKETALAQAKERLLESFDSKLKKQVRKSLLEGEDITSEDEEIIDVTEDEDMNMEGEDLMGEDDDIQEGEDPEVTEDEDIQEGEDITAEDEEIQEGEDVETDTEVPTDEEIEEIMRELKHESEEVEEGEEIEEGEEVAEGEDEVTEGEDMTEEGEEVDELAEILKVFEGEDLEDAELSEEGEEIVKAAVQEVVRLRKKLAESYKVIKTMRDAMNESTLVNTKMRYYNKFTEKGNLTEAQKDKVIGVLDSANNLKELKNAYLGLLEGFRISSNSNKVNTRQNTIKPTTGQRKSLAESLSRKSIGSTNKPSTRQLLNNNSTSSANGSSLKERLKAKLSGQSDKAIGKFDNDIITKKRQGLNESFDYGDTDDLKVRFMKLANIKKK